MTAHTTGSPRRYTHRMTATLETWRALMHADHASLRSAAAAVDATDVASVSALRAVHPADLVHAALQLAEARRKAADKLGGCAASLVADVQGVEQAGHRHVSRYKARRIAAALPRGARVADLCCGIGADARALHDAGLDVLAVDRDPVRAWMAKQNARCHAMAADVESLDVRRLKAAAFHIDPSRRVTGRRVWRLDDYQPGPAVLTAIAGAFDRGAIVLGPGVDRDSITIPGELDFVSLAGSLMQAVLWTGDLSLASRSATLLTPADHADACDVTQLVGDPAAPPLAPLGRFVYTVDAAAERAELLGVLCAQLSLAAAHPALGLLTGDHRITSPWLTGYELIEQMPWREKRVRQRLDELGAGIVEVKTRGRAVDTDAVQHTLRGRGDRTLTVFIHRWDRQVIALIAERIGG